MTLHKLKGLLLVAVLFAEAGWMWNVNADRLARSLAPPIKFMSDGYMVDFSDSDVLITKWVGGIPSAPESTPAMKDNVVSLEVRGNEIRCLVNGKIAIPHLKSGWWSCMHSGNGVFIPNNNLSSSEATFEAEP